VNAIRPNPLAETGRQFLARHEGLAARLAAPDARADAVASFSAGGLPTPRDEAWHYTNLRPLAGLTFAEPLVPIDEDADVAHRLPDMNAPRLVFIDGRFQARLSDTPDRFTVRTGWPQIGALADPAHDRLAALNGMLCEDGAGVEVPEGVDGGTLVLASLGTDVHGRAISYHPHHRVRLGRGARLALVELASGDGTYLHNPVLEVTLDEGATLTHLRLQDESPRAFHLSTLHARLEAGATYDSFALNLGARLSRMEVRCRLVGPGATAHLNAAQLLDGTQHADFTTVVSHDAPGCASRQTVKNVLCGRSHGVFQGKIEVARAAQKTDGYQMNQALLLSPDAEMNSKPQLEIYADDVKCSHGATVGALDADQAFYLRSRGIPEAQAREILVRAFLAEALDPIAHEAGRAWLERAVAGWWDRQAVTA
jgi:Fe-S cluster assembly protein SufD